jgi:hypothetical protein
MSPSVPVEDMTRAELGAEAERQRAAGEAAMTGANGNPKRRFP